MARIRTKTIRPGIRQIGNEWIAEKRVGSWRKGNVQRITKPFPLETPIDDMVAWQLRTTADLLDARAVAPASGTLAAELSAWVDGLPDGPGKYKRDSRGIVKHWIESPVGAKARGSVTYDDIQNQINRWTEKGAAVSTLNKRLSRLRRFFDAPGPGAPNPADDITFSREPDRDARDIPQRIVRLILDSLDDRGRPANGVRPTVGHSKIRLRLLAYAGIAPATAKRIRKNDLDLDRARVFLRPRRKGKGSDRDGAWIPLVPPAVAALRDFAAEKLFAAPYSASSIGDTFKVGIAGATRTAARVAADTGDQTWLADLDRLPVRCSPYDLRHAFAHEMYRQTGDITVVKYLLQHSSIETTHRYIKGAVPGHVAAAISTAADTFTNAPTVPPAQKPLRLVRNKTA